MERKKSSFFRSLLFLVTPEDSCGHYADADRNALSGICPLAVSDKTDYLGKIKAALCFCPDGDGDCPAGLAVLHITGGRLRKKNRIPA